jgi:hypothetical protein
MFCVHNFCQMLDYFRRNEEVDASPKDVEHSIQNRSAAPPSIMKTLFESSRNTSIQRVTAAAHAPRQFQPSPHSNLSKIQFILLLILDIYHLKTRISF